MMSDKIKKGGRAKQKQTAAKAPQADLKPKPAVPPDVTGKKIKHRTYGNGVITGIDDKIIVVSFPSVGIKKLGYDFCIKNSIIEFL